MKNYNGWSSEFRKASLRLTNAAKKEGWIKDPKKCNRCGQTEGILHLHNENYDATYYTLENIYDLLHHTYYITYNIYCTPYTI